MLFRSHDTQIRKAPAGEDAQAEHHVHLPAHVAGSIQPRAAGRPHRLRGLNRGIYESPFDAFTNYMNILGDFIKRVDSLYPVDIDNEELNALLTTIQNQGAEIEELHKELEKAQAKLEKIKAAEKKESKATAKSAAEKPAKAKAPAKKPVAKKTTKKAAE